jgi:hypothetical protein
LHFYLVRKNRLFAGKACFNLRIIARKINRAFKKIHITLNAVGSACHIFRFLQSTAVKRLTLNCGVRIMLLSGIRSSFEITDRFFFRHNNIIAENFMRLGQPIYEFKFCCLRSGGPGLVLRWINQFEDLGKKTSPRIYANFRESDLTILIRPGFYLDKNQLILTWEL